MLQKFVPASLILFLLSACSSKVLENKSIRSISSQEKGPHLWTRADEFHNGFSIVSFENECNYIDSKGQLLSKRNFSTCERFQENYAIVSFKNNKNRETILIDTKGNALTRSFSNIKSLGANYIAVQDVIRGLYAVAKLDGTILTPYYLDNPSSYSNDRIEVMPYFNNKGLRFGLADYSGNVILESKFMSMRNFNDQLIIVKDENNKSGLVDKKTGKVIIPLIYSELIKFGDNVLAVTKNSIEENGALNYDDPIPPKPGVVLDINNRKLNKLEFDSLYNDKTFNRNFPNYTLVMKNNKWGVLRNDGKIVVKFIFDEVANFDSEGYFPAKKDNKWGVVNSNGRIVVPFKFDGFVNDHPGKGYMLMKKENQTLLVNLKDGTETLEFDSSLGGEDIVENGFVRIVQNGKYALKNISNNEILGGMWFEKIGPFINGAFNVKLNGGYGLINTSGKLIVPSVYSRPLMQSGIDNLLIAEKMNPYSAVLVSTITGQEIDIEENK